MGSEVTALFVVIVVIAVALIFDFTNGFHDSANAMAGPVATGALKPRTAVILGAFLNLVGACLATVHGWVIVSKVLLPAIVAPLVAGIAAAWATRLAYRITRKTPSVH